MRHAKLRRTLIRLNNEQHKTSEVLKTNDKEKLLEEVNSQNFKLNVFFYFFLQCEDRLLKLKNDFKQEIADRDQQIDELKDKLSDEFNYQSEYVK